MDSSGLRLWLVLWKAYESLHAHAVRHIHSLGLGFSDFSVLEVLLHKGPTPVNTIGALVHLASGSITAAVDRMEDKGLVERCSHPTDRRTRVVHLTDAGKKLIRCAFADHEAAMERAARGLAPEERLQAVALLKKLGLHALASLHQSNVPQSNLDQSNLDQAGLDQAGLDQAGLGQPRSG